MPTFRRIRIHATVETVQMPLQEDQIATAPGELRGGLAHLDLAVLSIEPEEPAPAESAGSDDGDPWSVRPGRGVRCWRS